MTTHTLTALPGQIIDGAAEMWLPMDFTWARGCSERDAKNIGRIETKKGRAYFEKWPGVCVADVGCPYRPGDVLRLLGTVHEPTEDRFPVASVRVGRLSEATEADAIAAGHGDGNRWPRIRMRVHLSGIHPDADWYWILRRAKA